MHPPLARIPGIIFHASSATITAYGVAKKNPLPYYLIAVGLHVANNFFAIVGDLFSVLHRFAGVDYNVHVGLALLAQSKNQT